MTLYNKPLAYAGFAVALAGVCLDYSHIKQEALVYILLITGLIMMLLGFRKPKNHKATDSD